MAISVTEYENALRALSEALEFASRSHEPIQFKIARDATIQRFEFCVELAWKTSAKTLGSSATTAKPVIREMAQNGLISDPNLWFDFIEARNKSSHTYRESLAQEVYSTAERFLSEGHKLLASLKQK
jgi:nucleotidyltransferase substrate binding protein (TIGR01987 family)